MKNFTFYSFILLALLAQAKNVNSIFAAENFCPLSGKNDIRTERLICSYHVNGKLKVEAVRNDQMEALFKTYYESGALKEEMHYKDGKRDGIAKVYYESGVLEGETSFKDDKIEGIAKHYYETGKIQEESTFKDGKRDGKVNFYTEKGFLFVTIEYKNDSPVSGICHKTNGTATALTNTELTNWKNGLDVGCDGIENKMEISIYDILAFFAILVSILGFINIPVNNQNWGCLLICSFIFSLFCAFAYYEPMGLYLKIAFAVFIVSTLFRVILYFRICYKYLSLMDESLIFISNKQLILPQMEKFLSLINRGIIVSAIICMFIFGRWYYSVIAMWLTDFIQTLLTGWATSQLKKY